MGPYRTIKELKGSYGHIQEHMFHMGLYTTYRTIRSIQDHTGAYVTVQDHIK